MKHTTGRGNYWEPVFPCCHSHNEFRAEFLHATTRHVLGLPALISSRQTQLTCPTRISSASRIICYGGVNIGLAPRLNTLNQMSCFGHLRSRLSLSVCLQFESPVDVCTLFRIPSPVESQLQKAALHTCLSNGKGAARYPIRIAHWPSSRLLSWSGKRKVGWVAPSARAAKSTVRLHSFADKTRVISASLCHSGSAR